MPEPSEVGVIIATVVALLGGLMYLIRAEIRKGNDVADESLAQMVPNHGASLRDAVDRIEGHIGELRQDVGYLRERVDRHVDTHDHVNPTPHRRRRTDDY